MKYNKNQLQKYRQNALKIDTTLDLETLAKERFPTTVLALSNLHVIGSICYDENEDILLKAKVTGQITVPSSRSLAPVIREIDLNFDERYIENDKRLVDFEETDPVFVLENDTLNVDEAILDNVIAELPLQILTPEEVESDQLPSGKDWHVISEQAFENEKKKADKIDLDSRMAKLDDFFKK